MDFYIVIACHLDEKISVETQSVVTDIKLSVWSASNFKCFVVKLYCQNEKETFDWRLFSKIAAGAH